jgi:hypothetical protein
MILKLLFLVTFFATCGADEPNLHAVGVSAEAAKNVAFISPYQKSQGLPPKCKGMVAFLSMDGIDSIPDPTCKKGVASPDLKVCCADGCDSCGDHRLCDNPGKYHELTGKLVGQCCKSLITEKAPSCDKDHPPCVLSESYAPSLKNWVQDLPKRHAMQDCNKAIEISRMKQSLGVERGELLARLYTDGNTRYEEALEIAVKVDRLCEKKIDDLNDQSGPLKAKIKSATAADDKIDPLTGASSVSAWKDALASNKAEVRFYNMIKKNAKIVASNAKK